MKINQGKPRLLLPLPVMSGDALCELLRRRAGHNFNNFIRDGRLAYAVHVESKRIDQLARILGSRIHCRHSRALFGSYRLE